MSLSALLKTLEQNNIQLWLSNNQLRYKSPQGAMNDEIKADIVALKGELIARLQKLQGSPNGELNHHFTGHDNMINDVNQFEPFPQTPIQQAYLVGRSDALHLGGVAANSYLEFERESVDFDAAKIHLNTVIKRHGMLRTVLLKNNHQTVLENVPEYNIPIMDHSQLSEKEQLFALELIRVEMGENIRDPYEWPLFDMKWVILSDRVRLHSCVDLIGLDAWSSQLLFREWFALLEGKQLSPVPGVTFQQCLYELKKIEETRSVTDWEYWNKVLPSLPLAPNLPKPITQPSSTKVLQSLGTVASKKFKRLQTRIDAACWKPFKIRCQHHKVTPTAVLSTLFANVLSIWSHNEDVSLNFTLFNRPPVHDDINQVLGEFTNNTLVSFSGMDHAFLDQVRDTQHLLLERLEHSGIAGVDLLRALAKQHQDYSGSIMPVVITSLLMADDLDLYDGLNWDQVYGISQTPQVALDHQIYQEKGGLTFNWDVAEAALDIEQIEEAFHCYSDWIRQLSMNADLWNLPINRTQSPRTTVQYQADNYCYKALSDSVDVTQQFWSNIHQYSDNIAVTWPEGFLSYGQLATLIQLYAEQLLVLNVLPGDRVLVQIEKGPLQVIAVFSILYVGAVYVPISVDLPIARINNISEQTQPSACIISALQEQALEYNCPIVPITLLPFQTVYPTQIYTPYQAQKKDPAYIIFTSGSTGQPKGVTLSHGAVQNTLDDMVQRFGLNSSDRVFALSALNFDLSVYDIFAPLSQGAGLVLPSPGQERNPEHWYQQIQAGKVTIWNSVPTLLQMLLTWCDTTKKPLPDALSLFLVSGDWVPLDLLERLNKQSENATLIALGGATEAAIWSNFQAVNERTNAWTSVPYGKPLSNQYYRVLDQYGFDRPARVSGQLFIGGEGIALNYWGDKDKTEQSFIERPTVAISETERLYKTGDMGCFWQDGTLEFLGRTDNQIKLGGHRIELGEITSIIEQYTHIKRATCSLDRSANGSALIAYVVKESIGAGNITENNIKQHCISYLPRYMVPAKICFIDNIPLSANGKIDQKALEKTHIELDDLTVTSRSQINQPSILNRIFQKLLNQTNIDPHTNFFELSITSLQLVTAHGDLVAETSVDMSVVDFFTYTTIYELEQRFNELQKNAKVTEVNSEYA